MGFSCSGLAGWCCVCCDGLALVWVVDLGTCLRSGDVGLRRGGEYILMAGRSRGVEDVFMTGSLRGGEGMVS